MTKIDARLPSISETEVMPLVSIVIPTYNHARFLGDAIASAQAQTVSPHEIIVVDDGSTDDVAAALGAFRGVLLIRQENLGLAAARNTGWRAARGEYLVFLDADDRLLPRALEANLERFARNPECAFVYGGHRYIDREGRPAGLPTTVHREADTYEGFLRGNPVGMHATVMYRRDHVEEAGGFDASLEACEDYDLMLRLIRQYRVTFGPEVIAEYRRHGDNMSENVPMMLVTTLRVLRRQKAQVVGHPGRKLAFVEGLRSRRVLFAREALNGLLLEARYPRLALKRALALAHVFAVAPGSVLRVAAAEAWRRLPWRR